MATLRYQAMKLSSNGATKVEDALAMEHPLSVLINGDSFTITMQSPGHEMELIRGLLFTEGVIRKRSGALKMEMIETSENGFVSKVNVVAEESELDKSLLNKRNLLSVASCGICGKTELHIPQSEKIASSEILTALDIQRMFDTMSKAQASFQESGGSHAAAAFKKDGTMLTVMEDIGRHNAVDKVIGDLLNKSQLKETMCLLVSGRVSYEIVVKCFSAGIPFLLAVSAPSSLAVDFAKEFGITLLGFCREDRATIYSNPQRLV
ncbi:MAG: formate dehydrogenase accessory sulfurtransferase FdhD [Flavobacteriales bacterium]|nr:formate dehydrogenase accessory sulfurtransferase FdhD [Flavobacteriales bacterium]